MNTFILWVMLVAQGADATTSLWSFAGTGPKAVSSEANPLIISERPVPFIIQTSLYAVGSGYLLHRLGKNHPKAANVLGSIQMGASFAAAGNNIYVGFSVRRANR